MTSPWKHLLLATLTCSVLAVWHPRADAQSGYDTFVAAQKAVAAADAATLAAERAKASQKVAQKKADASENKALDETQAVQKRRNEYERAELEHRAAFERWLRERDSLRKIAEMAANAMMITAEEANAAEKAWKNKVPTALDALEQATRDQDALIAAEAEAQAKRTAAQAAKEAAQAAIDAIKNQPGKQKGLQQILDGIGARVDLLALAPPPDGASAVASGTDSDRAAPTATLVGLVLPAGVESGQPASGRLVTDPARFQGVPAIRVIEIAEVPLRHDVSGQASLEGIVVDLGDGQRQTAEAPLSFIVPEAARVLVTLGRDANPLPLARTSVPLDRSTPPPATAPPATTRTPAKEPDPADYSTQPVCSSGSVQSIHGPLSGDARRTLVDLDDRPAKILAETPSAVYFLLPEGTAPGMHRLRLREGRSGAWFPVCVVGLEMSADRLELPQGGSTAFRVIVSGPEQLPLEVWQRSGVAADLVDTSSLATLVPGYRTPGRDDRATILLRVENRSRATVTISPAENGVVLKKLDKQSFLHGPYLFGGTIRARLAGGFNLDGLLVAFFAPLPGVAQEPPASIGEFRTKPESPPARSPSPDAEADRLREAARKMREVAEKKRSQAPTETDPQKRKVLEDDAKKWEQMAGDAEQKAREVVVLGTDEAVRKARQKFSDASAEHQKALDEWRKAREESESAERGGIEFGMTGPEGEAARKAAAEQRAAAQQRLGEAVRNMKEKQAGYQAAVRERQEAENDALRRAFPKQ